MKRIVYNYRWKELTQEGLLKEPEDYGAYYRIENVNGWDVGYDSEEEAEQALIEFTDKYPYHQYYNGLVLVKITKVRDDE